jgi:hypothetical protein
LTATPTTLLNFAPLRSPKQLLPLLLGPNSSTAFGRHHLADHQVYGVQREHLARELARCFHGDGVVIS